MTVKNQAVPDEVLSKEFLSQFKTEDDVKTVPQTTSCPSIGEDA